MHALSLHWMNSKAPASKGEANRGYGVGAVPMRFGWGGAGDKDPMPWRMTMHEELLFVQYHRCHDLFRTS
jgi:hypothetical protein